MNLDRIERIAEARMGDSRAQPDRERGYILHHGRRVAALVRALAEQVNCDVAPDVLHAAGLFHDVGKGRPDHHRAGAEIVAELLADACTPDERAEVAELVGAHCLRGEPGYPVAAQVLQDADLLDHFGAQSVWMSVQYVARNGGGPESMLAFYRERYDDHVARHRLLINFDVARAAFDGRVAFERAFAQRFAAEQTPQGLL